MTLTAELVKAILMAQLVLALAVGEVVEVAMELLAAKMIHMGDPELGPHRRGGGGSYGRSGEDDKRD